MLNKKTNTNCKKYKTERLYQSLSMITVGVSCMLFLFLLDQFLSWNIDFVRLHRAFHLESQNSTVY